MLTIALTNTKQNLQLDHEGGPLEFGRGPQRDVKRLVIEDICVSRDQLRIEEIPNGRARVENLSLKIPVTLGDGSAVPTGGSREVDLPVRVCVGQTLIDLGPKAVSLPAEGLMTIAQPVRNKQESGRLMRSLVDLGDAPSPETITQWLETVIGLSRAASNLKELYDQSAKAIIDLVGLDIGLVLLRKDDSWQVVARAAKEEDDQHVGREFSQTLLRHVLLEKRTFFQDLGAMTSQESLRSVDAVCVSPIFGLSDDVVGVLYGTRRMRGRMRGVGVRPLEAQVVQLLAAAVGANIARTTAAKSRAQVEQFFSADLMRELDRDPKLLDGRSQEVTILMSDLRGFSTLSEKLGPQDTCRLVQGLMERLSERVTEFGGVVVNYLGDGLLAMWNAPAKQENHAALACKAAIAMLEEVPPLSAEWLPVVGKPLAIGIGINTGVAQVGNTGSTRKFMYGPLGNTVNLASRVEGATKQFGVSILVTGSTRALIGDAFATRRLCPVRVVGIKEPVELFELHGEAATADWVARRDTYEAAQIQFEKHQLIDALQTLIPLVGRCKQEGCLDAPTVKLMTRITHWLGNPNDPFDPVLDLTSK